MWPVPAAALATVTTSGATRYQLSSSPRLGHRSALRRVRHWAEARATVVLHVLWLRRRGYRDRHGWVPDDPLEEVLAPACDAQFRSDWRQRLAAYAIEHRAVGERAVREDRDPALLAERQQPCLGFAFRERIVHLYEVELLRRQHLLEFCMRIGAVVREPQVTHLARVAQRSQRRQMHVPVAQVVDLQQVQPG